MARLHAATPLIALDAIAVDTETTGLDTAVARIVQIGAVEIARGRAGDATYEALVDPGVPIPPKSSAVHGISDADVAGAPDFAAMWPAFSKFADERLLIGHSIGFDLAVMEKEAARADIAWVKPRSLCVRLLTTIANPRLPDNSLETIAGWLGVPIAGRHSALGDARAAAAIFSALLPKLAERGIRTVAEAERACLGLTEQIESHHRAGWAEPVTRPDGRLGLGAVDPYAYRTRVADVMSAPPVVVAAAQPVKEVIDLMVGRRISSVFVSDDGRPGGDLAAYGIVTERDMMRLIATHGAGAFGQAVGPLATRPLASIRAAAFVYRAVGRMDRLRIRHLAVRDPANRLAGIVSARDLLRLRAGAAISLDDEIEAAKTPEDLAAAWATLPGVANGLIGEQIEARTIAEIVSEELRSATKRAGVLAEAAMKAEGLGEPPCRYALLVLGSGGRGESLLAADQDNAIVFAEGEPDGPEDRWFAEFGSRIAAILDTAGIPYCKGGIMAKNPQWRGSIDLWKRRVEDWVGRSRPEDLLNVDIFFDLAAVHGSEAMADDLRTFAFRTGGAHPLFAKLLGEQIKSRNPFTLLGGFHTEDGRLDLKMHGLFPIVATARTLAIRRGVPARSTRERLEGLIRLGIGGESDLRGLLSAHGLILAVMLAQQAADLHTGVPVSNKVEIAALTRDQQAALKTALKQVQVAPALVRDLMFG